MLVEKLKSAVNVEASGGLERKRKEVENRGRTVQTYSYMRILRNR
jgi:hypothetical protein